jgi:hypothetical protein
LRRINGNFVPEFKVAAYPIGAFAAEVSEGIEMEDALI